LVFYEWTSWTSSCKKEEGLVWKILLAFFIIGGLYLFLGKIDTHMIILSLIGIILIFLFNFILKKTSLGEGIRAVIIIMAITFILRYLSPFLKNLFSDGSIAV